MKNKFEINWKKIRNKGFTLAELLIVVAIIAVLVAVSIPIFTGKLEQARVATTEANIRSAKAAAIADWMDTAKANGEEIDEELYAKLNEMVGAGKKASPKKLSFSIAALAKVPVHVGGDDDVDTHSGGSYDGENLDYGSGSSSSGSQTYYLEGSDGKTRTYGYSASSNSLYRPTSASPTSQSSSVFTEILVEINTEDGTIKTCPHITGSGSSKAVNNSFGVNSSDVEEDDEESYGGSHSG